MDRETRQFETPVEKHKVVMHTYLTGGEKRIMQQAESEAAQQERAVEAIIVSIDDKSENLMKVLEDMHGKDFDFVFVEMADVINDSVWAKKKES